MLDSILFKIIFSLLVGAAIGLERENRGPSSDTPGGIRTYSLICLLGSLCGLLYINNYPAFSFIISGVFFLLFVVYTSMGSFFTKQFGLTTELSILFTYIIGLLVALGMFPMQIVVAIIVILLMILSLKSKSKKLAAGISRHEMSSFISYAIIALVILPFLPDVTYKLSDMGFLANFVSYFNLDLGKLSELPLINPRNIWFIVVLVTGIDVFGYLLAKFVGHKKSFGLTSFVGGFVSSTSTTQSLSQRSKKQRVVNYLVGAALLANMASFFQLFLLVGPLNGKWLAYITPTILILILSTGLMSIFFMKKKEEHKEKEGTEKEMKIFSLLPALKFASLLIIVKIFTKLALILFGQSGFIISSIIASFAGIDAVILSLAEMAGGLITFKFALFTFILVNATNLLSKSVYSFLQGDRRFAYKFITSVLIAISFSFVGLLLL